MTETIASAVERFVEHKRAHGRKYHSEARELALLGPAPATSAGSRTRPPAPARVPDQPHVRTNSAQPRRRPPCPACPKPP
jgi:hypothetical protein